MTHPVISERTEESSEDVMNKRHWEGERDIWTHVFPRENFGDKDKLLGWKNLDVNGGRLGQGKKPGCKYMY